MTATTVKILQPTGILDGANATELRNQVMDLVRTGTTLVLIDLQEITFMNSSGIGALVATLKAVRGAGAQLFVCSLSDQVRVIFELTKMDRIFKPFEDRQEFEQKIMAAL
jgi:anti-anti-sigma factor